LILVIDGWTVGHEMMVRFSGRAGSDQRFCSTIVGTQLINESLYPLHGLAAIALKCYVDRVVIAESFHIKPQRRNHEYLQTIII